MALLRWIRSRRDAKLVALHVETLLTQTVARIRTATLERAASLPRPEARGYIRAKAVTILSATLEALQSRPAVAVPVRLQPAVLHTAADRVTIAMLEQAARARSVDTRRRVA